MTPAREWLVTLRIQVARADVGFALFLGLEGLFMTFVSGYQAESLRAQAHEGREVQVHRRDPPTAIAGMSRLSRRSRIAVTSRNHREVCALHCVA